MVIPPVIIIPDNQHFTDWCVRMADTGRPGGGCSWAVSTPASHSPTPRVPGCMLWPTLWAHISRWIDIINNTKNDAIIFISHARSPTASLTASCCPMSSASLGRCPRPLSCTGQCPLPLVSSLTPVQAADPGDVPPPGQHPGAGGLSAG